jgi:alginate O-acetyltransferase complex protein AlgJ
MDVNRGPEPILNQTQRDHLELASTEVSPGTARFLSLTFVAILFAIPIAQASIDISRKEWPQALELFQPFVSSARQLAAGDLRGAWASSLAAIEPARLHGYEDAVESESILASYFQPRTQQILTGWFGAGNDKAVLGRDGWIFYLPGLDYVVGPSVADRATFERVAQRLVNEGAVTPPQTDPRPALLDFARQCREAGIHLVVVPVPDKAMMQPAQLYARPAPGAAIPVPNNVGYRQLVEGLRAQGIDWFDPAPPTVRADEIRYLEQDTHWTPAYMDEIARAVADHVRSIGVLPDREPLPLRLEPQQVSRVGDLVDMLSLTPEQTLYQPRTVTIERVIDERTGQPLTRDATADVMLLGDSFTNIYSAPAMGWGTGAGLAQHLAYHLQRPVDVIAFNGGAATQSRAELARSEHAERLGHKKVIVYQFAIRALLTETWEPSTMVTPRRAPTAAP